MERSDIACRRQPKGARRGARAKARRRKRSRPLTEGQRSLMEKGPPPEGTLLLTPGEAALPVLCFSFASQPVRVFQQALNTSTVWHIGPRRTPPTLLPPGFPPSSRPSFL